MKNVIQFFLICLILLLSSCESDKSLEKAIQDISLPVTEIITTELTDEGAIVFFVTSKSTNGIGIAFFMGNDKEGWRHLNLDSLSGINNSQFTVDSGLVPPEIIEDKKETYTIFYGRINNPDISNIKIVKNDGGTLQTKVIKKGGKIIYFSEMHHSEPVISNFKFQAISKEGKIVAEQGSLLR
jgi:hypothetical protein